MNMKDIIINFVKMENELCGWKCMDCMEFLGVKECPFNSGTIESNVDAVVRGIHKWKGKETPMTYADKFFMEYPNASYMICKGCKVPEVLFCSIYGDDLFQGLSDVEKWMKPYK